MWLTWGTLGRSHCPWGYPTKTVHRHLRGPKGQKWGGGSELGFCWLARYSQCLVGAVLGLEEAQDEEAHCL